MRTSLLRLTILAIAASLSASACASARAPLRAPAPAEIPLLEERIREAPTDAGALLRLGAAYLDQDRPEDARSVLERAAANAGDDPLVRLYLGMAYEELERWEEARAAFEEVLAEADDPSLREAAEERLPLMRRRALEDEVRATLSNEQALSDRPPTRGTVAVYPFLFTGDDEELGPLGTALAELVVSDLSQVDRITVLERLRVQLLLDEMELADGGYVDPATAARPGRLLGAERVVRGTITEEADRLRVLAGLVEVETGQEPETVEDDDALRNFIDLEKRLVLAFLDAMGIELTASERELVLERPTESLDALILYGRALEAEGGGDFGEAAQLFEAALEADPGFDGAQAGAQRTGALASAGSVTPAGAASAFHPRLPPSPAQGIQPVDFQALEILIPTPGGRDPVAEVIGSEGLGPAPARVELILRPPSREEQ